MFSFFTNLSYPIQAMIAAIFTWAITSIGAAVVFLFKKINKSILDAMLGFAAGVMIAATFFSMLAPAIEVSSSLSMNTWLVISIGFLCGGILLYLGDKLCDYLLQKKKSIKSKNSIKRSIMLIFSITLHNIPEGMAIGVAFGSVAYGIDGATITAAIMLAIGIGIQNFPEGSAVSIPLRRDGISRTKAFLFGSLSGIVEPISATIGAILVLKIQTFLPFLLSFAGGAMIYVVVQELIPESQTNEKKDLMALFTIFGFIIMMVFDIALG